MKLITKIKLKEPTVPQGFSQAKNLVRAFYLFVISTTLLAWNDRFEGNLSGFAIPSLLALLAFGFMWVHYLTGYLKTNHEPELSTKLSLKISQYFVLAAIIAHPIIIIYRLKDSGYGLPPESITKFFGSAGTYFVPLGELSLIAFLLFELKSFLKKRPKLWSKVLILNDLAMLLIVLHGFKLGLVIKSGWFKYIWLAYGLSLLYFLYNSYVIHKKLTKYVEAFIISLVALALVFISLATPTRLSLNNPSGSSSSSRSGASNQKLILLEELTKNNGLNGNKCWIAVGDNVYEIDSDNAEWQNGQHIPSNGLAKCGEDLSSVISQSPHGTSVLGELKIIGSLQ